MFGVERPSATLRRHSGFRWWIDNGMFTTGARTPLEFMAFSGGFTLEGVAQDIRCPTLVTGGNADHFLTLDDSRALYDKLPCPKTFLQPLGENQANMHCQVGALTAAAIFDRLDEAVR